MKYLLYADESGIHKTAQCYTIGAILVPEDNSSQFQLELNQLRDRHGLTSEIKWENVRTSYNLMNYALDLLKLLLRGPYVYTCIVVLKSAYRKWQVDETDAFYTTYTMLVSNCTQRLDALIEGTIDEKSESYDKHHEVVQIIANYKLKPYQGEVAELVRADSKECIQLQAVDIITGAVNAAHDLYLNPDTPLHKGKRLLLERLSTILGWDHLHYDTLPNVNFNIWHFPHPEYRAKPETRDVKPNYDVPYVTRKDIELM